VQRRQRAGCGVILKIVPTAESPPVLVVP